jgi:hypothetical protein
MPRYKMQKDDLHILQKEKSDSKSTESQQESAPGLIISGGEIEHGEFDTKDWYSLIDDYTKMRNGDPVISTTTDILKYPMMMASRIVTPGSNTDRAKEAAEFVDWTFENLVDGFDYLKYHKLLALDFGVSVHEVIVKNNVKFNGKTVNRLVKLAPIMPETIVQWHYNKSNFELEGIQQEKRTPDAGSQQVDIPVEKLEIFTYNKEFDDVRGRSMLRPIRTAWSSKSKLLINKVIATQRGAGIVSIQTDGAPSTIDQAKLKTLARTLSQGVNTYSILDKNKAVLSLLTPQNQQDIMQLMEYLDRQIFFNTMTEFLTAGIGQNGSRAATSEHKSAYELSANYILSQLETDFQDLTDRIIDSSVFATLEPAEKPIFTFAAITQTDLFQMSQMFVNLFNPANGLLQKKDGDLEHIREMFGLPNTAVDRKVGENIDENASEQKEQLNQLAQKTIKVERRKLHECEVALEKASEMLEEIENVSRVEIDSVLKKALKDAGEQLEHNPTGEIELRYRRELAQKMIKQYGHAFESGQRDVMQEFEKIEGANKIELSLTPKQKEKKNKRIDRAVDKLYYDVRTTLEDKVEVLGPEKILASGGFVAWALSFLDKFKGAKRKILTEVDGGYVQGRGDSQKKIKKDVQTWFYSARLHKNLCDNCAPYDGQIFTTEEVEGDTNLNFAGSNVNTSCLGLLGPNHCWCTLVPFKMKKELI